MNRITLDVLSTVRQNYTLHVLPSSKLILLDPIPAVPRYHGIPVLSTPYKMELKELPLIAKNYTLHALQRSKQLVLNPISETAKGNIPALSKPVDKYWLDELIGCRKNAGNSEFNPGYHCEASIHGLSQYCQDIPPLVYNDRKCSTTKITVTTLT